MLIPQWPGLRHVKLVRWHQRPQIPQGSDFTSLFEQCSSLTSLDLSEFYYWTEDLPPVLQAYPSTSASLTKLNLLTKSFSEGFKSSEIQDITKACPNLTHLLIACMFDPRYVGFVGEEALLSVPNNCPKLTLLHLADTTSLGSTRGNPNHDGYTSEDARISHVTLVEFFSGLPLIEELVLDVCKNVRDSGLALEVLGSKCPKLRVLKLGQFHSVCMAVGSNLDGVAFCQGLESLSIKNSADLDDMRLIEIGRGCGRLKRFEVIGCKRITVKGVRTLACLLSKSLVEVKISSCINLDAAATLRALEPLRDRIERLHIDCLWGSLGEEGEGTGEGVCDFDPNEVSEFQNGYEMDSEDMRKKKKCKYSSEAEEKAEAELNYLYMESNGNGFLCKRWERLRYLSLWIAVGELLTPLPTVGLEECPNLEEIRIQVEGDCRERQRLSNRTLGFGLSTLAQYPQLSKMQLDCSDAIGFALTAPSGQMDLSLWERFFLTGIENLSLNELDYWPPQDQDVNQRSLSLPAAGLLAQCHSLRKLFIHGTAHEHFMNFLLRITNLRDVQLREDYYPAPENDMSTEMRVDSCCRFEDALNDLISRPIPD